MQTRQTKQVGHGIVDVVDHGFGGQTTGSRILHLVISQGAQDVEIDGNGRIRLRHHFHRKQLCIQVFACLGRLIEIVGTGAGVNDPGDDHAKIAANRD